VSLREAPAATRGCTSLLTPPRAPLTTTDHSDEAIDNDDGSCYFNTHNNFFYLGKHGMKSEYEAHTDACTLLLLPSGPFPTLTLTPRAPPRTE
jgi:hypothetical protein